MESSFKQVWVIFKFILLLSLDIKLNPGPITLERNMILWGILPFHNCSFSTEQMDISLILYLRLASTHGTCFKKEVCTSFI